MHLVSLGAASPYPKIVEPLREAGSWVVLGWFSVLEFVG